MSRPSEGGRAAAGRKEDSLGDWCLFVGAVRFCGRWRGQVVMGSRAACNSVEILGARSHPTQEEATDDARALARDFAQRIAGTRVRTPTGA